jgi:hypothetical protein
MRVSAKVLVRVVPVARVIIDVAGGHQPMALNGHLKTGHRRSLQNRPTDRVQDIRSFILVLASFSKCFFVLAEGVLVGPYPYNGN